MAVNDKNEVLLQHKDSGAPSNPNRWCLFGGAVESGETAEEAIIREIFEELEWKIKDFKHVFSNQSLGIHREVFYLKTAKTTAELKSSLCEGDDLGFLAVSRFKRWT